MSKDLAFEENNIIAQESDLVPNLDLEYSDYQTKKYELIKKICNKDIVLSYSWIKELAKSPAHFLAYKLKEYQEPNESMIFGSICDLLITEPDKFDLKFTVVSHFPSTDNQRGFVADVLNGYSREDAFKNNYSRGNMESVFAQLEGYINCLKNKKTPITTELYDSAKTITDNLLIHDSVQTLIGSCNNFQEKIEWEYEGWKFKGIKDCSSQGLIVDLKSTKDSNPDKFERDIFQFDYYLQMAMYSMAENYEGIPQCFFLAYDKSGHFSILKLDYSFISYGQRKLNFLLSKLDDCIKKNRWNESYNFFDNNEYRTVYKPKWSKGFETDGFDE
ncbi:PD-(D/E)XK nuclease-like domain-containing protein [Paenimyroides ceti]